MIGFKCNLKFSSGQFQVSIVWLCWMLCVSDSIIGIIFGALYTSSPEKKKNGSTTHQKNRAQKCGLKSSFFRFEIWAFIEWQRNQLDEPQKGR